MKNALLIFFLYASESKYTKKRGRRQMDFKCLCFYYCPLVTYFVTSVISEEVIEVLGPIDDIILFQLDTP